MKRAWPILFFAPSTLTPLSVSAYYVGRSQLLTRV
jgi:hypothetical protein